MPWWFCASKPKKQKNKKKAAPTKGCGPSPHHHHPHHHRDNVSGFVVVRQSTSPQAPDELPVVRGQVVELLYTNREWNYVKNVEGQSGYIPRDFCLPLESLEQIQSVRTAGTVIPRPTKPRSRPRPLNLTATSSAVALTATTPQAQVTNDPCAPSGTPAAKQHAPEGNDNNTNSGGGGGQRSVSHVGRGSSNGTGSCGRVVDSGTLDSTITTSSTGTNTSTTQCCSTLFGFKGTRVVPVQGEGLPSSSSSSNPARVPPEAMKPHEASILATTTPAAPGNRATPTIHRALHRATSYQEAVITADQKLYGLTAGIRPTYLPLRPLYPQGGGEEDGPAHNEDSPAHHEDGHAHNEDGPSHYLRGTLEHNYETLESIKSAATPITVDVFASRGGVFRYEETKPQGIFIAESDYRPRLQGEVPLRRGEMVMVMDYGQGGWAWVLTASNQEGAVPKSVLSRYLGDPMTTTTQNGDDEWESAKVSTGTQTELVVNSAVVRDSSSSGSLLRGGASPASLRGGASPASLTSKSHHNSMSMRYSVATGGAQASLSSVFPRRHSAACAWTHTSGGGGGREWFKSSEQLCEEDPEPSPQANRQTPSEIGYHTPPQSRHRTPPPQSGHLLPQPTTPTSRLGDASTLERDHQGRLAASGVDFEPEYDTISCISEQRRVRQTPVLIALRDCTPPATSKNTLVLKKGDILHHHPQESYPNGWMWVYHTSHKCYGYVPKTHVAYMYVVQKKSRKDELSKEESV